MLFTQALKPYNDGKFTASDSCYSESKSDTYAPPDAIETTIQKSFCKCRCSLVEQHKSL